MSIFPSYAPIHGIQYNHGQVMKEVLHDCKPYFHLSGAIKDRLEYYNPSFSVCTDEELEENSYQSFDGDERIWHEGKYNAWKTCNLTWVPDNEDSKWQNVTTIDGKHYILRDHYREGWEWRPEFEDKLPHIRHMVDQFPFEYLQCVRLITMLPPAIGMVHQDSNKANMYLEDGFATISVSVLTGGAKVRFEAADGSIHDIGDDYRACHFDDRCLHGITKTDSFRIQFRLFGKMDYKIYMDLMDLSKAIW